MSPSGIVGPRLKKMPDGAWYNRRRRKTVALLARIRQIRFDSWIQNDLLSMWIKNEYDGSVDEDDPALVVHQ